MSKPANLSELYFRVIYLTQGFDTEQKCLVIVVGKDTEGKPQVWADNHSFYKTEHQNLTVREALRAMAFQETPFLDAPDYIRNEWLNPDGTWFLNDKKEITVS